MSNPVFDVEKVVIDPLSGKYEPTIDPTGGTIVESTRVRVTGLLADSVAPVILNLRRGHTGHVWQEITDIKPSSAVLYTATS